MKCKTLRALQLLLALALFAAGSGQGSGLDLVLQQIETIGPRQWLGLMARSIVPGAPLIAPVRDQVARAFSLPFGGNHSGTSRTA